MAMTVEVSVNGEPIRRLRIENLTLNPSGTNTYRWTYVDLTPESRGLLSAQQGRIEHTYEDGAMALISKVAAAAAQTEI